MLDEPTSPKNVAKKKHREITSILNCIISFYCLPSYYALKQVLAKISENMWLRFCSENTIYLVETYELVKGLSSVLKYAPKPILEVFAGRGKLAYWLRRYGIDILATDDYSWKLRLPRIEVIRMSASEALQEFNPKTVVTSWIPANEQLGKIMLENPNIEIFIDISSGVGSDSSWSYAYSFASLIQLAKTYNFLVYPLNDLAFFGISQETVAGPYITNNTHVYVFIRKPALNKMLKYLVLG